MSIVVQDWYSLPLETGDLVIPICSEALIANISGEIKDTCNANGHSWLRIFDTKRNYLLEDWFNASYFSTQERFDERK